MPKSDLLLTAHAQKRNTCVFDIHDPLPIVLGDPLPNYCDQFQDDAGKAFAPEEVMEEFLSK